MEGEDTVRLYSCTDSQSDLYEWESKYNQVWFSRKGDQEIWKNQETKVVNRIVLQQIVSHKVIEGEIK